MTAITFALAFEFFFLTNLKIQPKSIILFHIIHIPYHWSFLWLKSQIFPCGDDAATTEVMFIFFFRSCSGTFWFDVCVHVLVLYKVGDSCADQMSVELKTTPYSANTHFFIGIILFLDHSFILCICFQSSH